MTPEQQTPASVVERLRDEAHKIRSQKERGPAFHAPWGQDIIDANNAKADLFTEAAALIERLSAEREGLREALRPFALAADNMDGDEPDTLFIYDSPESAMIDYADLRRARAALTQGESRQTGVCICVARGDGPEGCGICNETGVKP